MRRRAASAAKPNPAHFALAKLEHASQDRLFVCTQNVYSLHEQAGSRNAAHMHGELVAGPTIGFVRVERPVNWIVTARL
ncbi:MAG: Sir2 family NAD-dependent protein deacetylase [Terriglobales bacterium]